MDAVDHEHEVGHDREAGGGHVLVVEDGEHDVGGGVRASAAERDDGVHRAWPIMMQSGGLQSQSHGDDVELEDPSMGNVPEVGLRDVVDVVV